MVFDEAPSRRMAWDADGSVALVTADLNGFSAPVGELPGGSYSDLTGTQKTNFNNESQAANSITTNNQKRRWFALLFPEPRELDGIYWSASTAKNEPNGEWVTYSLDTTNGIDGAWVNAVQTARYTVVTSDYRDEITSKAVPSVKGLMAFLDGTIGDDVRWSSFHVYGVISAGETPDRILFLDTENADATFTKVLDFGDVPRGQTTTRTFKIKNNSGSKTINTIQITAEDIWLNAGDWYTFGDNGVDYQATFAVGNLGPGSTKLLYLKQVIPGAETVGPQAGRIKASHASVT